MHQHTHHLPPWQCFAYPVRCWAESSLTHHGPATPYGVIKFDQHWFRYCLGACVHQGITWTKVDKSSGKSSQEMLNISMLDMSLKMRANELTHCGIVTPYGDRDLPSSTKHLPELVLIYHQSDFLSFSWWKFHRECLTHQHYTFRIIATSPTSQWLNSERILFVLWGLNC